LTGSLEVGKAADLVVLETDPRTVDPEDISEIGIVAPYFEGRPTHQAW